jgi:hypothetical protein
VPDINFKTYKLLKTSLIYLQQDLQAFKTPSISIPKKEEETMCIKKKSLYIINELQPLRNKNA